MNNLILPWGAALLFASAGMVASHYGDYWKSKAEKLEIQSGQCIEQLSETETRFNTYQHAVKDAR